MIPDLRLGSEQRRQRHGNDLGMTWADALIECAAHILQSFSILKLANYQIWA